MEKMIIDFSNYVIKISFRALSAFEKLRIMLDIIDLFIVLHAKGIVHSDVKPANIMMKYMGFMGIRIIDLGMADKIDNEYHGGTKGYLPPEVYKYNNQRYKLQPKADIFALGVTFAQMAGEFDLKHTYIPNDIQTTQQNWKENYQTSIRNNLAQFSKSDIISLTILSKIKEALSLEENTRISSMRKFSDDFVKIMRTIVGFKDLLKKHFENLDKNFKDENLGYWKSKLVLEFGTPEQIKQYGPKDHLYRTQNNLINHLQQSKQIITPEEVLKQSLPIGQLTQTNKPESYQELKNRIIKQNTRLRLPTVNERSVNNYLNIVTPIGLQQKSSLRPTSNNRFQITSGRKFIKKQKQIV